MNPSDDPKPTTSSDLMGHVPRKKKAVTAATTDDTHVHSGPPPVAAAIPRKHKLPLNRPSAPLVPTKDPNDRQPYAPTPSARPEEKRRRASLGKETADDARVRIASESPFIVTIATKGMPGWDPNALSLAKRPRQSILSKYKELEDTDSDDFMTEAEEKELLKKRLKKRRKKLDNGDVEGTDSSSLAVDQQVPLPALGAAVDGELGFATAIEAPPPGELSTLWYSKECFLHIFVVEKICGWKTRPKVRLVAEEPEPTVSADAIEATPAPSPLDLTEATRLQQKALLMSGLRSDPKRRMEISRINPIHCPVVMGMAAKESVEPSATVTKRLVVRPVGETKVTNGLDETNSGREEVMLVKWRGRSYMHSSWERAADIDSFDPSTNNAAKNKIRRFYQQQEAAYGLNWKRLVEEERNIAASIHMHESGGNAADSVSATAITHKEPTDQVEEYFSPQCLEVERILACDESEMDMKVFAKQRAFNIREEQNELRLKERELAGSDGNVESQWDEREEPWDTEDNVRYVVKWKGSPYVDMTWEYWWDIKRDAVDHVENFWYRQQAPDVEAMKVCANRPHPLMKEFKKLQESPFYGVSKKPRPIHGIDEAESGNERELDPGFRLRSYQLEGVNWLLFNWWNKRSCILADEMGLGKTIQSAAFLQELQTQPAAQVRGPFLVVAPLSLIDQWQSELQSWAPDLNVVIYHGSAEARDFLVKHEFYYSDPPGRKGDGAKLRKLQITKFHIVITTYEVVLKDTTVLSKIRWRTLIVDEAHRLKNYKARLFDELASVPRDHCVLLTGTPIANATEELWALLHFANPQAFQNRDDFLDKFGAVTDAQQVNDLHTLLKPYLLRRVKEDVEKSLPNKEETILEVSLTPIQKNFYKAIYERNTSFLFKGTKANNAPSLMNVMMELRKCCNHPFLVKGAEDRILNEAASKIEAEKNERGDSSPVDFVKLFAEQLVKASGKMVLMEKLLEKLFHGGHKVLVFSQMVRVLDLLEDLLKLKKYRYERLDGTTSSFSRLHAVERFKNKACNRFVMLLSTRAGGLGLNLTVADCVIIFDSDWNPQNDNQAMARAHRIGQTKSVKVYRLLTAKTYEMHMFHSASLKLGLERAVLSQNREQNDESEDGKPSSKKIDREAQAKEIDELLKKGAYDVFRDDDDGEAEKFMESDIDQLLMHSSKTVSYGAAATSSLGGGLGSFSKASFVADTDDGAKDVDLDDPDFWSKAIGLEVPPEELPDDLAAMLDDGVKRNRKQVQQYDPYAETAMAEQMKKDRLALEKMLEKEEKDRQLKEKKLKKTKAKEERRIKSGDDKGTVKKPDKEGNTLSSTQPKVAESLTAFDTKVVKVPKLSKDLKPRKGRKGDRARAIRRAEDEFPLIERLKQAWEIPQRNRATAAAVRFGFGRFCKLRNESNLTSLPLHDVEIFVRSYFFQLVLQVSVTILTLTREEFGLGNVRLLIQEWIGSTQSLEVDWLCDSLQTVLKIQSDVVSGRRFLRIPLVLTEPTYLTDLRYGAAVRAVRRIGLLSRLNNVIDDCLETVISSLSHEELGKRGCGVNELANLDVDLKSRFVTCEELALAVSATFQNIIVKSPAAWWDRSCDVALVVGTFVHGLGNYDIMRRDTSLPFGERVLAYCGRDGTCEIATQRFRSAAAATVVVFEDALEAGRVKAEAEVQAAVAAAAKAAREREVEAALLRKGGADAEVAVRNMVDTQVEDAFEFDGTDSHFVTLPRLHESVVESLQRFTPNTSSDGLMSAEKSRERKSSDETKGSGRIKDHHLLPMPDARILDYRLVQILNEIDRTSGNFDADLNPSGDLPTIWKSKADVVVNFEVRNSTRVKFEPDAADVTRESVGVGLSGNQCGISHRTLNDGSDYGFGSASSQISALAYGTDAPRYLRALVVPMNVTRYAISAIIYAETSFVTEIMSSERLRFFGREATGLSNGDSVEKADNSNGITDNTKPASSRKRVVEPVNPADNIDDVFRLNARLRATVCVAVIFYGFPSLDDDSSHLNTEAWESKDAESRPSTARLFNVSRFREVLASLDSSLEIPDAPALRKYVESVLLPHCLHLCVCGNGPATRNARGSHGDYETAFGVSVHPEPSQQHPTPLPDPCLPLREHSLEALGLANAMLRRVRLLRTCTYLCSERSEVPVSDLLVIAKSKTMSYLEEMPLWWCPWIHDVALLRHAATEGLFAVVADRTASTAFGQPALLKHIHANFVDNEDTLPEASTWSSAEASEWAKRQADLFPTLYQLERRLGLFCGEATSDVDSEVRFDFIPMFDHGGWPRK